MNAPNSSLPAQQGTVFGWKTVLALSILPLLLIYQSLPDYAEWVLPDRREIPVSKVLAQNLKLVKYSWEHGVLTHALLEFQNPELSVFAGPGYGIHLQNANPGAILEPFPGGQLPKCGKGGRYDEWTNVKALRHAASVIVTDEPKGRGQGCWWLYRKNLSEADNWASGDASAADSASLGWMALLLERAGVDDPKYPLPVGRNAYGEAADGMVDYLVRGEAKGGNVKYFVDEVGEERKVGESSGRRWAISHRCESQQLWGDFVFMVPPFLAAYGVARGENKWIFEAAEQILVYRDVLRIGTGHHAGLWKHILSRPRHLEAGACCHDEHLWLSSNAWALAGITRVLAVLERYNLANRATSGNSPQVIRAGKYRDELKEVANEMLKAMFWTWDQDYARSVLRNYLADPTLSKDEKSWDFEDPAATALITSSIYRLAQLDMLSDPYRLGWADQLYDNIERQITDDGLLTPVATVARVPSSEQVNTTSEAQSFVLMMYAARRDLVKLGLRKELDFGSAWLSKLLRRQIAQNQEEAQEAHHAEL